ncbi:hypothetical protein LTR10_005556 [Elasticomyces elasticus]|nr:hypothetical protein LTR10_005556 [Elasticomyces elasticus]KAK4976292.1 hypothetical protein LTR42_003921 [Elasticomyces elasticus]
MEDANQKAAEMDDEELRRSFAKHGSYAVLLDDALPLAMLGEAHAHTNWSDVGPRLRTALGNPHLGRWFCMMFHTFLAHDLSCLSTAQEHVAIGKGSIKDIQFSFKAARHSEESTEEMIGIARDLLQKNEVKLEDLVKGKKLIEACKQSMVDTREMLENEGMSEAGIEAFQATLKETVTKAEDKLSRLLVTHQATTQTEEPTEPNGGTVW